MKILFYCPFKFDLKTNKEKFLGGIESLNIDLAEEIAKKNYKVYLASFTKKKKISNKVINLPIQKLYKENKKIKFDIIISSNEPKIFDQFKSSKKIFWMHNTLSLEKAFRKRKIFSLLTNNITTIFVSKFLKDKTSNIYLFNKKKVISNFLTKDFILDKIPKTRKPIFVWSVQRDKGLAETIGLWIDKIHPYNQKAQFHIFGIKKIPGKLNSKILKNKNIFFFGKVKKRKLREIYSKSMAMICLGYDETFCLNAIEANACGLPVITLGKTALKELIIDNKNGFLIKNLFELENKIKYIINFDKNKRLYFIKNSLLISKKYYLKNVIHNWFNLLK